MDHEQEVGGVVLSLSHSLQIFSVDHGLDLNNSCVWVTLLLRDKLVGWCSIYARNCSSDGCTLSDVLASFLVDNI